MRFMPLWGRDADINPEAILKIRCEYRVESCYRDRLRRGCLVGCIELKVILKTRC
jgi:hypothetical protein